MGWNSTKCHLLSLMLNPSSVKLLNVFGLIIIVGNNSLVFLFDLRNILCHCECCFKCFYSLVFFTCQLLQQKHFLYVRDDAGNLSRVLLLLCNSMDCVLWLFLSLSMCRCDLFAASVCDMLISHFYLCFVIGICFDVILVF